MAMLTTMTKITTTTMMMLMTTTTTKTTTLTAMTMMTMLQVEGEGGPSKDPAKTLRAANERMQFLLKYGSEVEILQVRP